ncbi:hypothetical protein CC78DRAFT_574032 [Lojkania enalia]|uniref:Uncharacterized protein n=1 Tax=Lojkania enalia TaxID=147567 RepID=A0A9P4NCT5_9PLEO|nr:hypothetical protein CC78DRAFT_574032 [Didymosphaeria enalia]
MACSESCRVVERRVLFDRLQPAPSPRHPTSVIGPSEFLPGCSQRTAKEGASAPCICAKSRKSLLIKAMLDLDLPLEAAGNRDIKLLSNINCLCLQYARDFVGLTLRVSRLEPPRHSRTGPLRRCRESPAGHARPALWASRVRIRLPSHPRVVADLLQRTFFAPNTTPH